MERIVHSHRQSKDIEDCKIKKIDINTWLIHSTTPDKEPYIVLINTSENCIGCPLACPMCHIRVHQFTCTCVDYKIKGNFCKHVHACIRIFNEKDIEISIDEDRVTLARKVHNNYDVQRSQIKLVDHTEYVSISTHFTVLFNAATRIANCAT